MIHIDLQNEHYCGWLRFLRDSESWSIDQINDYQLKQIHKVVTYAYENSKGYRRLYDSFGLSPDSIKALDDFKKFPLIDKETIRDNLEEFSTEVDGRVYVATGGSTGIPFGFYRDPVSFGRELASKAYQYYRVGWKEGDRQMVFRGVPIETNDHMQYCPEFNELRCSSYHLTPEWMETFRKRAFEYQPEWIRCYPSSGYIFARYLRETGKSFLSIKGILCASENLYDFQKHLLSEAFNARVFSHYGHYEMAVLAGFCEYEDSYHVLPQYGYAELIGADGKVITKAGQAGEIVGTSFIMYATPFIRYRTRDFATLKGWGCSKCGRPYQIWEKIEGRLQEFIVTGGGRYISMTAINMHDDIFGRIKQFQFFQRVEGKVTFKFIPKETINNRIIQDMKARLMIKLGNDVELEMLQVEEIPLTARGKHRFLIQKMKLDIQHN